MDSKTLMQQAAADAGIAPAEATALFEAFSTALRERVSALDTVAIPGFGSFVPEKRDEYVDIRPDGTRVLMPPAITLNFTPGSMLRKHLATHE